MAVGMKDVAGHAGVSVATVSNVLNHPELVAAATRDRVQRSIDALGFVRNESARQLRAGRSRFIGLLMLDIGNPFFTDVALGAEAEAEATGYAVVLCDSRHDVKRENRYLELLEEQRVGGILVSPVNGTSGLLRKIRRRGTPVVLVDRVSRSRSECCVAVDDIMGGDLAVSHLLTTGHRRMAFVGGPFETRQVRDRYDGGVAALLRADRPPEALTVVETPLLTLGAGKRAGEQIAALPRTKRPTAVFCANDLLALGLLQEMTRRKISVPEDLAIIGYDDIGFAAAAAVPLSSVRQPSAELGSMAARLVIEEARSSRQHRHRHVVFKPELVVRASSNPAFS
ncbi:MAG: LacI family DNA-binding transcriptional regulator [Mycobacteriales bacterium]